MSDPLNQKPSVENIAGYLTDDHLDNITGGDKIVVTGPAPPPPPKPTGPIGTISWLPTK